MSRIPSAEPLRIARQSPYLSYPSGHSEDFGAAGVTALLRCDRVRTDVLRPGLFPRSPDDASARLVPNQPRPVAGAAGDAKASRPFAPEPGLFRFLARMTGYVAGKGRIRS
jgi:hypothetical protein